MTDILWKYSSTSVSYPEATAFMEEHVARMHKGEAQECAWFLEHEPIYTMGTSAQIQDILDKGNIPTFQTNRGGRSTYHGPGQRVIYLMLNIKNRGQDLRHFVWSLEEWLIRSLKPFNIEGFRSPGRVGIWVNHPTKGECKIAAIGVRIRHWITFHGISLNIAPNLDHYQGIVPCGLEGYGVTSFQDLGIATDLQTVDAILQEMFMKEFLPCLSSRPVS